MYSASHKTPVLVIDIQHIHKTPALPARNRGATRARPQDRDQTCHPPVRRTKRNDFTVGLTPPNLRYIYMNM